MTKLYKVLGRDGEPINGGHGEWSLPGSKGRPGKWMSSVSGPVKTCENGYHLCQRKDILSWCSQDGITIYEAEPRGETDMGNDKMACRSARLLRKIGCLDANAFRLFAADCAEHVLWIFERERPNDDRPRKAIAATRDFARGEIDAAALAAAGDAAWAAARDAARDAAWAAARDAERKWQELRLWEYITGKKK